MLFEQEKDLAHRPPAGHAAAHHPQRARCRPRRPLPLRDRGGSPGRDIGGDWYDLIPLPGGRVGAVIGDVQGHDTHAAAVMGQLRIVLRAYAAEGHPPATVMARASVFLHELDTDRFATCLYAEADLATGVVQVVRAGHIDPLIRHTDGSCRRLPVEGGLPLGLSAEFQRLEYPVTTLELDPGHTLLLCTDGLVEQPGADLDDGMRTLAALIATGPQDVRRPRRPAHRRGRGARRRRRRRPAPAAPPRPGNAQRSGGRLQQHVAPGDPEALAEARHMIRAAVARLGRR